MKPIEFKITAKAGKAVITAYDKRFTNHKFRHYTGMDIPRRFDPARPGQALKRMLEKANDAVESLYSENIPVTNGTLKSRLDLVLNRFQWLDNELSIWTGTYVHRITVPDGAGHALIENKLLNELSKSKPDFSGLLEESDMFVFWKKVIDGKIKLKNGKTASASTASAKNQTFDVVKRYQAHAGLTLNFESMNRAFYNEFTTWMEEEDYDPNTIGKHIKELKATLSLAQANELFDHNRHASWPAIFKPNEVVTPNKDELLTIINLELTGTLEESRDNFVLACFLGPRIGDWNQFDAANLTTEAGIMFFSYVQEKTGQICKIPVHPIARAILDKRDGLFPPKISEQNLRYAVKDFCALAAEQNKSLMNRVVTKIRGNKPVYAIKHQAITPHTARRTFATSLYYGWFNKPMPAAYCMHYTGHRKEESFRKYINAKAKEVGEKALEYFSDMRVAK